MRSLLAIAVVVLGCHRDRSPPPAPPPAAVAKPPLRGAAGDEDLRVMLAEIASSKACQMIEGQFLPLRAPDRPAIRTGTLWIRHCEITNEGTHVTFVLSGDGWQWADQTKHRAGGTFVVRDYVKFDVRATVHGALDLAYDRGDHVLSLWYSPAAPPEIDFQPIGTVDVDSKGLWSDVVGGLSSAIGSSPDEQGTQQAKQQGTHQFERSLADGLTVAIGLCTGYQRFTLGRAPKGSLGHPEPGESPRAEVELHAGGLAIFGPQPAPDGMTIDIDTTGGAARVGLACANRADEIADAYAHSRTRAPVHTLAQADVAGHGHLRATAAHCPIAVIVQPLAPNVTIAWQRPAAERARAFGGSIVQCRAKVAR
jgi:hypothetical protein